MKPSANAMKRLFGKIAHDLGDGVNQERLIAQKIAVTDLVILRRRKRVPWRALLAAAAAIAIAVSAGEILYRRSFNAPLPFRVGDNETPGQTNQVIETAAKTETLIAFGEGSRFALRAHTVAKVVNADDERVELRLDRGVVDADINGNRRTVWRVFAGPYLVSVLGTRFTVRWQETADVLDVEVTRGKVLVQGPGPTDHGVVVTGGNRFRATEHHRSVFQIDTADSDEAVHRADERTRSADASTACRDNDATETAEVSPSAINGKDRDAVDGIDDAIPASPQTRPRPGPPLLPLPKDAAPLPTDVRDQTARTGAVSRPGDAPRLGWLVYYESKDFRTAFSEASAYGIDALSNTLNAADLWKLQDAARITGNHDVSAKILTLYRRRFPRDERARVAAFLLGKIASDVHHRLPVAIKWFNTYLAEAPNGPLAEVASGRLIVVYDEMGQVTEAEDAARRYLERFEGGAYERAARSIVDAK